MISNLTFDDISMSDWFQRKVFNLSTLCLNICLCIDANIYSCRYIYRQDFMPYDYTPTQIMYINFPFISSCWYFLIVSHAALQWWIRFKQNKISTDISSQPHKQGWYKVIIIIVIIIIIINNDNNNNNGHYLFSYHIQV